MVYGGSLMGTFSLHEYKQSFDSEAGTTRFAVHPKHPLVGCMSIHAFQKTLIDFGIARFWVPSVYYSEPCVKVQKGVFHDDFWVTMDL